MRLLVVLAVSLALASSVAAASSAPASASVCGAVGWFSGAVGKVCGVVTHGDRLIKAGKKLASGHIGGAAKAILSSGAGSKATAAIGLAAIGTWVLGGAKVALSDTAEVLSRTASPRLGTTWFSTTYWRMAGIAAVLTLPFLFAAAIQAMMRSDLALLARAALGYLPLSLLAVSIAAPITMLLLSACDEMSAIVSSAAGHSSMHFLTKLGVITGGLVSVARSPFLAFLVGLLTATGAIVLWIELLMREAAMYIVLLMLPLAFAALVWPARRVWAIRAAEMLVALILSKFAIVAVLSLGGAALDQGGAGGMLAGLVLVILGAFAPWALVRLLPLAELAGGAAGQLRGELLGAGRTVEVAGDALGRAENWAGTVTAGMRHEADGAAAADDAAPAAGAAPAGDRPDGELDKLAMPGGEDASDGVLEDDRTPAGEAVLVGVGADGAPDDVASGSAAAPDDRRPGPFVEALAANRTRRRIVLGPEEIARAEPLWSPEGAPGTAEQDPRPPKEGRRLPEDDPRPPQQDPGEGRL